MFAMINAFFIFEALSNYARWLSFHTKYRMQIGTMTSAIYESKLWIKKTKNEKNHLTQTFL